MMGTIDNFQDLFRKVDNDEWLILIISYQQICHNNKLPYQKYQNKNYFKIC